MASSQIKVTGKLAQIEPEYLRCIWIYLLRGNDVLAHVPLAKDGTFNLPLLRQQALAEGPSLQLVAGPAGMATHLDHLPNLKREPLKRGALEKADSELRVAIETPAKEILRLWWTWCRWYCVSGNIVGPDGCPVPGAQVTVKSVGFYFWGFTQTPEVTVFADPSGNFTACFCWCSCTFCFDCWPCWPIWWSCWPWWWEFDILHVIETLERNLQQPTRAFAGLQTGSVLTRPTGSQLIQGQGFLAARKAGQAFAPDASRTALIQRKLSNAAIRDIFPYWWWCCDNPNIIFEVTQGSTVIVDENPAIDTRWCFPNDSTVTLVGNAQTISACTKPPVEDPFAWTRVGLIPTDAAHITGGYAVGAAGTDDSDLAFAGTLDIYGGFGDTTVAYYQVNAALWTGDPSRSGTPPTTAATISASLYNYVYIYDSSFNLVFSGSIQMGPFNQGALTNLYATQQARQDGPTPPGLTAFPAHSPSDFIIWAYDQRLIYADSSSLIGGAGVGAVDLTVNAYTTAFAPVTLPLPSPPPPPPDTSAVLTLTIDNTAITTQQVTGITAYTAGGTIATQTGTGECPAYDVGPGGYVEVNTTVSDANGHLYEYYVDAEYGHGNETAIADPGVRGYRSNPLTAPAPAGVCGSGDPDYGCKGWSGGADVAYFPCAPGGSGCTTSPTNGQPFGVSNEPPDCCYEFRIRYAKRVTNGYNSPTLQDGDFQTISLKFSS
ncbi:MAG: hypothetical protein WCB99_11745 [Candidatus Cybelea sp.]